MTLSQDQMKALALAKARQRQQGVAAQPEPQMDPDFVVESALALGGDVSQVDQQPVEPQVDPGVLDYLKAVPEVAKTMAAGVTVGTGGYVHGLLEGLLGEIKGGRFGTVEGAENIQRQAMKRSADVMQMFAPESEAGQQILESVGEVAEQIPPFIPLAAEAQALSSAALTSMPILTSKLGRNVNLIDQKTGLPSKELSKSLSKKGVKYSLLIDDPENLPVLSTKGTADEVVDSVIRKRIVQRSGDESLANYRLEGAKVVPDDLAAKAVKQGYRPGDVAAAKNANKATRAAEMEMLQMKRKIHGDSSLALDFRPADVAGREAMKRFDFVKDKALSLRDQLNAIAKGESPDNALPGPGVTQPLKGLAVDPSGVEAAVFDGLKKINVNLPDEVLDNPIKVVEFLKKKDAFVGSDISKDRTSQRVIRDTLDLLTEGGNDAQTAHRIKRQIDTMIDFRKRAEGGLTESGQNFAKSIRRELNQSIRDVHPTYAKINDELSRSLEVMNNIREALPNKIDLYADKAEGAFGQELRKLLGKRQNRQQLRNSLKELDNLASDFGADFQTDVDKLVQFNNTLDDRFGDTARGSFKAEIESANIRSLRPTEMLLDKASKKVVDSINELRRVDDEAAFNTMQEILKRDN